MPRSRTVQSVDLYVAARIAARRSAMGLSQAAVARRLGVSTQQFQKYETGANRISASRLSEIALCLGIPPGDLFPEAEQPRAAEDLFADSMRRMTATSDGQSVALAFPAIRDRAVRQAVARIVEALAAA